MAYAYSENFILPISHDEVVHGKGSMFERVPQDEWRKFGTLRAFYAFMWAHPGKKLLFMGTEFGQRREFSEDRSIDWWQSAEWGHRGVQRLVKDLNTVYRDNPALWKLDTDPSGFSWIDADDARRQRLLLPALRRRGPDDRLHHQLLLRAAAGPPDRAAGRGRLEGDPEHRRRRLRRHRQIGNLGQVVAHRRAVPRLRRLGGGDHPAAGRGVAAARAGDRPRSSRSRRRSTPASRRRPSRPRRIGRAVDDDRRQARRAAAGPGQPARPSARAREGGGQGGRIGRRDDRGPPDEIRRPPARRAGGGGQRRPAGRAAAAGGAGVAESPAVAGVAGAGAPDSRRRPPTEIDRPIRRRGGRGRHAGLGTLGWTARSIRRRCSARAHGRRRRAVRPRAAPAARSSVAGARPAGPPRGAAGRLPAGGRPPRRPSTLADGGVRRRLPVRPAGHRPGGRPARLLRR